MKTYTRQQLLNNECTHREYYAQFVTEQFVDRVSSRIGKDELLSSKDKHLNDIPLKIWDAISPPLGTGAKMRELGDYLTQSGIVCIAKEAARQFLEKQNKQVLEF
jgi:hypothetical protein